MVNLATKEYYLVAEDDIVALHSFMKRKRIVPYVHNVLTIPHAWFHGELLVSKGHSQLLPDGFMVKGEIDWQIERQCRDIGRECRAERFLSITSDSELLTE